ncbi:protein LYRIC-like [Synchiropus picturatus]
MAGDWRGFAQGQADWLASRVKNSVSSMESYVRTQFGLDLGLQHERYPPWLLLLTAATVGLLLLLGVAFCGASWVGVKKRRSQGKSGESNKATVVKNVKPQEPKKRNRKKATEKKVLSNGQPATIAQHPVKAPEVVSKKPPPTRAAKAAAPKAPKAAAAAAAAATQVKKESTKTKTEVKLVQPVSTNSGRSHDEGAWETKVSSRERRQQRRKDKNSETSVSPGGGVPGKILPEASVAKNKNKNPANVHFVPTSRRAEATDNNDGGWIDVSSKGSARVGPTEGAKSGSNPSAPKFKAPSEAQEKPVRTGTHSMKKSDLNPASFSMINPADSRTTAVEFQWSSQRGVDDDWSALNGVVSMDTSSDWNAPAEYWGNYEDPSVTKMPMSQPATNKEEEKDAVAKSRRRRKKKRTDVEASPEMLSSVVSAASKPPPEPPAVQSTHKKLPVEPPQPALKTKKKKK